MVDPPSPSPPASASPPQAVRVASPSPSVSPATPTVVLFIMSPRSHRSRSVVRPATWCYSTKLVELVGNSNGLGPHVQHPDGESRVTAVLPCVTRHGSTAAARRTLSKAPRHVERVLVLGLPTGSPRRAPSRAEGLIVSGQAGQAAGPGHHPLRGRLRRRHAAHRRPLHPGDGVLRQRPLDAAELPGRDPRPPGHPAGRVVVPGPLRRPRHPHPGRPARRAGRDEPRGAQGEPARPARAARRSSSTPTTSPRATSPRPATPRTRSRTTRSTSSPCTPST